MSRVIINGDDFGMNKRCSLAIARAFRDGLITDTTVMANGEYFDEAIGVAFGQGFSDRIGIHFDLTEGAPLTADIRSLADFVCEGRFCKKYLNDPRPLSEAEQNAVYAELSAQIEKVHRSGIVVTHADSHHYIHNNKFLAPIAAKVCRENGINKIRLKRNFGLLNEEENNRFWREQGFITTAYFGRMSDIISADIPDDLEIMVHPDFDENGVLIDRRGVENGFPIGDILCDLRLEEDVILQSYRDLSGDKKA